MKIEISGFSTDSDIDFTLVPEYVAEVALLKAMRAREVSIVFPSGTTKLTFRAEVVGKRI